MPGERPVRTAAVVGAHWGLTYVKPLRAQGVEVVALATRNRAAAKEIAQREGIELGTDDLGELADADLVVVAAPAPSHAEVISAFPEQHIICEKPLVGTLGSAGDLPAWADRLLVNYAFSYLETARIAESELAGLGAVTAVRLRSTVNMPQTFNSPQWLLESASHPLSWLLHLFGAPTVMQRSVRRDAIGLDLVCGNSVRIGVDFEVGGEPGIHHEVQIAGSAEVMGFTGSYVPGSKWRYSPVVVEQREVNEGEYSETDCWRDANARAVEDMVRVFRGELDRESGLALGLFDRDKALWLEGVLSQPVQ